MRQFRREGESVFLFHQPFTDEAVEQGRNAAGIFPAPTEMGQTGRTVEHNPGVSWKPGFSENRRRSVLQSLTVGEGNDFVKIAIGITKYAVW